MTFSFIDPGFESMDSFKTHLDVPDVFHPPNSKIATKLMAS